LELFNELKFLNLGEAEAKHIPLFGVAKALLKVNILDEL